MNSRSLIERSVASLASFSTVPHHLSRHWRSASPDVTGPARPQQQLAFQARPVYTLPLGTKRRICSARSSSMSEAELKTEPTKAASPIVDNLEAVRKRVHEVAGEDASGRRAPRLVAVSKTKPLEDLEEAYAAGQRIFGENYVSHAVMSSSSQEAFIKMREESWKLTLPSPFTAGVQPAGACVSQSQTGDCLLRCTRPVIVCSPLMHVMSVTMHTFELLLW